MSAGRNGRIDGARARLRTQSGEVTFFRLGYLEEAGYGIVSDLPFSWKVLLESLLRRCDGLAVGEDDVAAAAAWGARGAAPVEIPFTPARVILQDFTGVPALADLAAMRSAMKRMGADPARIEPLLPAELVVDHSIQVDSAGLPDSLATNMRLEFERNRERYEFLKWGQQAFEKFKVVPPGVGIVHQVNIEKLARAVFVEKTADGELAYPDSVLGTDSHTTMINGLGIVGWGVGGIEAEAAMLGQPVYMLMPDIVGVKIVGRLGQGATATDLALHVTQMLRKKGVVGKFVEFFGAGLSSMSLPDRATLANMAPEYGATMGFFPWDAEALAYLRRTGRPGQLVDLVERYAKEQGLFRTDDTPDPRYSESLLLDLASVEPSLAGPKRPQDRVALGQVSAGFRKALGDAPDKGGFGVPADRQGVCVPSTSSPEAETTLCHGSVVIAAITSCTNTSNPSVMLAAGLLARKAVEKGLSARPTVKASLAPGSRVVTDYLERTGLLPSLEALGFHVVGYGCTTCIGNSGPLPEDVSAAVRANDLVVASVLSGNRNFEGRVNPLTRANYLASPPLVVAYALAGRVDIDLTCEPLGRDPRGEPVYLKDVWPAPAEVAALLEVAEQPEAFRRLYEGLDQFNPQWREIPAAGGVLYDWKADSTYIQEPPFFAGLSAQPDAVTAISGARVLAVLGDSVTTDHISPAGSIATSSPAAAYLRSLGVPDSEFNSYGSRRGNDRVMVRGTFANIRLRNGLAGGKEGGVTTYLPDGREMSIYDAAMAYRNEGVPLVLLAGKEYGAGSSRDWAAKGTLLLGVRAVLAESYERIHRSNLVGMGVLPLQFLPGESVRSLGLTGRETFAIDLARATTPRGRIRIQATGDGGETREIVAVVRIDTPVEVEYFRHGGILPYVLRQVLDR